MPARLVNWSLFWITFALIATGVATLATNRDDAAWLYELHRYSGVLLCLFLIPKSGIIARSYARRLRRGSCNDGSAWAGLVLTIALLVSMASALIWSLDLAPFWIQVVLVVTPLALHWYLGLALVPLFLWHIVARWITPPRLRRLPRSVIRSAATRRQSLNLLGAGVLGVLALVVLNGAAASAWRRRFTGSRLVSEFTGNDFPVTHSDTPPSLSRDAWRLELVAPQGHTEARTYDELLAMPVATTVATIDCTLGWASTQAWRGVKLSELVRLLGGSAAASVTVYAATGAFVILSPEEVAEALVATHVGAEPLNASHGFPARLVVPTRRGYQWLKWINRIILQEPRAAS